MIPDVRIRFVVAFRRVSPVKNRKNTYPFAGNDVFPEGVDEKLTAEIIGVVADHFNEVSQYRYSLRQPLDFRTQFFSIPDSPEQIVIALKIVMKLVACFGKGGKIERFDPVLGIA